MHRLSLLIRRFARDESGIFGVLFAIMAVVLVALSGAVVDFVSVEQARTRAQVALDAAALALQPRLFETPVPTEESLKTTANTLLTQQFSDDATITAAVNDARIDISKGTIDLYASITVPTNFVRLVGVNQLQANLLSEATRGSVNLEVALALDTTGSMNDKTKGPDGKSSTKIADLRDATATLIDLVVKDQQTPTYTKMALVPYSNSVNVGSTYADKVRGTVDSTAKKMTNGVWASASGKTISGATKADPVVVTTSSNHGLSTGDYVYISGISNSGMRQINETVFKVTKKSNTTVSLQTVDGYDVDGRYYNSFYGSGTITRCTNPKCEITVTSSNHGYTNGQHVYFQNVGGLTQLNSSWYTVASRATNTFIAGGSTPGNSYSSGGSIYCADAGCQQLGFTSATGSKQLFPISNCVSERTTNPYNDAGPTTTLLGRVYASSGNPCDMKQIVPLTSNKTTLRSTASSLNAAGSTGGQIGLAWAWYMVSPKFAYLWPAASKPAAYDAANLQKVVVLMTDGAFNTTYCNGVISQDSLSGSGSGSDHINCDAPNGNSFEQGAKICDEMKKKQGDAPPVIVFTVGFDIADDENAKNLMKNCATDAAHAYTANNGTDLKEAFKDIGQNIAALRVSK